VKLSEQVVTRATYLPGIVLFALALRLVVVACVFRAVAAPTANHSEFGWEMGWTARSIVLGHGFSSPFLPFTGPTALVPPLYPYLIAGVEKLFGLYSAQSAFVILSLNSLLSALTCIPIYLAASESVSRRVATFAAWGWAIYPFAIYFSATRVWEFSLTSLLVATCFWLALRLHAHPRPLGWLGFGLLFGLSVLSNPAVLSLFPVLLILPVWRLYRSRERWLRTGCFLGAGMLLALTPWTIRNYRVMHVICPVRDCFWYEFWSANNGDGSNPTLAWTHPASNPAEMSLYKAQGETAYIAQKRAIVRGFVSSHYGFFAGLTLRRMVCYWTGFWSLDPEYMREEPTQLPNVFMCTSLTALLLLGACAWWRRDRTGSLPYLLTVGLFPVTYYVTHPLMDYRQAIEPEIVILVVLGLREVKWRLQSHAKDMSDTHLLDSLASYGDARTSAAAAESSASVS
jgi:4-amino-4-deoxy-L-arabinose transferase-like glycosyltransferase